MSKKNLVIKHDLSKLNAEEVTQYLRDVSEFIDLDPDLNGLDTIWMDNEQGPGKSLVVYARRGTAEILRNKRGIEVSSLTNQEIKGSIVFTATGKDKTGRQEIATGSKDISKVSGKQLDDAIMTASTRALRRLTMQFTGLGILDESEVKATVADTVNPAAGATLAGSAVVMPPAPVAVNNGPGKDVTPAPESPEAFSARQAALRADAIAHLRSVETPAKADIIPATQAPATPATPAESTVTPTPEADNKPAKPKRARKPKNTVSLEGPEPEVVDNTSVATAVVSAQVDQFLMAKAAAVPQEPISAPAAVKVAPAPEVAAAPAPAPAVAPPAQSTEFEGKPTEAQMGEYRKKVSVYTSELPSSENMGSVQKMRAFITKMSGTAPQFMTVDQWQEMLGWFESFVEKNKMKGLVTYINDVLGVK